MYTSKIIGSLVRKTRKRLGIRQRELALAAGTGLRFISDLENGKPSCELEKVLKVLQTLGLKVKIEEPKGYGDA